MLILFSIIETKDFLVISNALKTLVEWQQLGLELGLLKPTLEMISINNMKEIQACKREMLAAWLRWQDNVKQKGLPSWTRLLDALEQVDAALAAEIERSAPWRQ